MGMPAEAFDEEPSELSPVLQARSHTRRRAVCSLSLLLCICVLERCTFYEYVADVLNTNSSGGNSGNFCGVLGDNSTVRLADGWQSQILLGLAYLLPLLGGFAADWHFGCQRVLQSGCALYCLGAWLMVCLVYVPQVCSPILKYISQGVLALGTGLIRPSLMVMSYELGEPLLGTIGLCHLYYACEATGQIIGCSLSYITDLESRPLTAACVPTSHAMILLAVCTVVSNRSGWNPSEFQLPTWLRIHRIIIIIWPIILLSSILLLTSFTFSGWELTTLAEANGQVTQKELMRNSDLLLLVWSVALLVAVATIALLTHKVAALRSQVTRIAIGMVVIVAIQFVSFGLNLRYSPPPILGSDWKYIYSAQSILGAIAESLTYIAANEVAFRIAPVEIRTFMLGLFMSLKGSGFFTSIIILFAYLFASEKTNPTGVAYVHLSLGLAQIAALLFFLFTAPAALHWLVEVEEAIIRRARRAH